MPNDRYRDYYLVGQWVSGRQGDVRPTNDFIQWSMTQYDDPDEVLLKAGEFQTGMVNILSDPSDDVSQESSPMFALYLRVGTDRFKRLANEVISIDPSVTARAKYKAKLPKLVDFFEKFIAAEERSFESGLQSS